MLILITVACLVLAATPGGASMCSDADGMSDEIRKAMLDKHNELRSLTAKGLAVNFQGGYAPKAARMLKMSYDCDIEVNTMNWIKQCKWGHNSYQERKNWGQNIFRSGGQANKLSAAVKSVESWFNELTKKGIKPGDNNRFTDAAFSTAGHYTQVVWQKSHKLGCAVYWCPGMTYVGCEYSPAGNMRKAVIYDVGEPCTKNEDCGCTNCVCSRTEALCIPPSAIKELPIRPVEKPAAQTKPTPATQSPVGKPVIKPKPYPGTKKPEQKPNDKLVVKTEVHCPFNNGMSDEVRQMFLNKHNGYRSLVAKGKARDRLGGFAPKAARMPKLTYSCSLEARVMNWIERCKPRSSPWDMRRGIGENIWMTTNKNMSMMDVADASTSSWFSTLEKYGIGPKNFFTMRAYFNGLDSYAQMVWQRVLEVGCGVVSCQSMTLVACQYNRIGDFINKQIYEKGEPCRRNSDCMCPGCRCSRDEALCIIW